VEAAVVALAGAAFAFAANQLSPRGLNLARNYFPGGAEQAVAPARVYPAAPAAAGGSPEASAAAEVDQRLKDKGLQPLGLAETERLFRDPRRELGLVVFVDARDEEHYRDGHIPGAYALNPYHPEKELSNVLGPCQSASQVVVYCTGGECEDADSTALFLRDAGIPLQKLFVFGGGYTEWTDHHLAVERGERNGAGASGEAK
jgi:rhodanese-related sulfurtransferase